MQPLLAVHLDFHFPPTLHITTLHFFVHKETHHCQTLIPQVPIHCHELPHSQTHVLEQQFQTPQHHFPQQDHTLISPAMKDRAGVSPPDNFGNKALPSTPYGTGITLFVVTNLDTLIIFMHLHCENLFFSIIYYTANIYHLIFNN